MWEKPTFPIGPALIVNYFLVASACALLFCDDSPGNDNSATTNPAEANAPSQDGSLGPLVSVQSGLPDGMGYSARYVKKGTLSSTAQVRMLIGYPLRAQTPLMQLLHDLYDPTSPQFRAYLSVGAFMAAYGPDPADTGLVETWLRAQGLTIAYTASNHLMIQVNGSAAQINRAFGITLLEYDSPGDPPVRYYGTTQIPRAPAAIAGRVSALLLAMPPPIHDGILPDTGRVSLVPPPSGVTVDTIRRAYQVNGLGGANGQGMTIGIIAGGDVRLSDLQSFWQSQGIHRDNPTIRHVLDRPGDYNEEATLDAQWAGAMAPGAQLIMYQGPDPFDASVSYLFNEAIGRGEVQVVTTSFSHHESDRPPVLRLQSDYAARMAAALGITVLAASGDSAAVDIPASCPYVTAVGGTTLRGGYESAWQYSGSGASDSFDRPWYQWGLPGLATQPHRATVDLSLNVEHMIYFFGGKWSQDTGTSFATPAFAGIMASINSARAARALPPAGFLNAHLYTMPTVQRTFHDITAGGTSDNRAGTGWDYPTGWGTPNAAALAATLP